MRPAAVTRAFPIMAATSSGSVHAFISSFSLFVASGMCVNRFMAVFAAKSKCTKKSYVMEWNFLNMECSLANEEFIDLKFGFSVEYEC